MRNVSNAYIETMEHRRDFYAEAEITFADGQTKTVNKKDFWISGNSFTHSAGGSSFPLGMLIAKRITLSLNNQDDQWSEYDFFGAKIQLFTRFKLDDSTVESINMGEFTVITPETYGTTVEVTAMDESYKTDIDYSTGLTYPLSLGVALRDSCQTCGITLLTPAFPNSDFVIQSMPEKLTHRQFIGLCAMLAGGNAVLDEYNRLKIITYDLSPLEISGLDGGKFDAESPSEYVTGDTADGGSFAPWDVGYIADGGAFGDRKNIHILYEVKSGMTVGVDDVVITGVQIQDEEDNVHLYGKEGYVISIENQLATGKEDEAVQRIGDIIVGLRFRPFTADHIAYPLAEFMDPVFIIDRKQNVYQTVLTDIEFHYFGFTNLKCNADSPLRNSSKYNNAAAKAVIESRKIVNEKISQYDRAMQTLTNLMTQSFGVFKTEEVLEDGSTIFYMHNKPTLEESQTIWKMTADAFAVSTDGGKTWNAGIDSQGNAVVNVLSAIGISADWMTTGALRITDGSGADLLYADYDTKQVRINAGNVYIGTQTLTDNLVDMSAAIKIANDNINLKVSKGNISSEISQESGKISIKSNRISIQSDNFTLSENGTIKATNGNFSGSMIADNGTYYAQVNNGQFVGGQSGQSATGYVSFNTRYTGTGMYGARVAGKGILSLLTPYIGVGGWVDSNTDASVNLGQSASLKVVDNMYYVGDEVHYTTKTLTFINGIMVTAL